MMSNDNKNRGKTCVITLELSCASLCCSTINENGGQSSLGLHSSMVSCWPDILLAVKSILHSGYLQEPCLGSLLLEELSLISTALLSSQNSRLLWRGSGFKSFCFCFCTFLKVNHHPLLNLNPHLPPVANKCKVQWPDHGSRFYSEFLDRDQPCLGCLETLN